MPGRAVPSASSPPVNGRGEHSEEIRMCGIIGFRWMDRSSRQAAARAAWIGGRSGLLPSSEPGKRKLFGIGPSPETGTALQTPRSRSPAAACLSLCLSQPSDEITHGTGVVNVFSLPLTAHRRAIASLRTLERVPAELPVIHVDARMCLCVCVYCEA